MNQERPGALQIARQGHRYTLEGNDVLALSNGPVVKVLHFDPERPWIGHTEVVPASLLIPQPMTYFRGQTPK